MRFMRCRSRAAEPFSRGAGPPSSRIFNQPLSSRKRRVFLTAQVFAPRECPHGDAKLIRDGENLTELLLCSWTVVHVSQSVT